MSYMRMSYTRSEMRSGECARATEMSATAPTMEATATAAVAAAFRAGIRRSG
jgi:hypothetical protein